jgi:UDP-N-acetylmuramoyl-L-alanyl-D-glutamate--2,6-diaminopimelate ligase
VVLGAGHPAGPAHEGSDDVSAGAATPPHRDLAGLAAAVPSPVLLDDAATAISGLACGTDLDDVRPGVLFAPLDLPPARAAALAARAVERGAAALLLECQLDLPVPQVIVPAVRPALAQIAAAFYGFPATRLRCIGVTGTAGKTTTTLLIDTILRAACQRPGLIGTLEWRVGEEWTRHQSQRTTPEAPTLQRLLRGMVDAGDQWAILEASSQGLALNRLDTVPFAVGAVTHVTQGHLDAHGSIAAYRRAKAILFERVAQSGGIAVLNADDPAAWAMRDYAGSAPVVTYSAEGRAADIRATNVEPGPAGTRFTLSLPDGAASVTLSLLGAFNVANALCAAAVAHAVGIPLAPIARALAAASPIPGRLAPVDAGQPFLVLVDKAQSASQLASALEIAHQLTPGGRVIVLVGGSDAAGSALLLQKGEVAALAADYAVFTTQHARVADPAALVGQLAVGARAAGGVLGSTFACVEERRAAIGHALGLAQPGDCVLLIGKGDENTLTAGGTTHHWDEAAVARQLLAGMGYAVPDRTLRTRRGEAP